MTSLPPPASSPAPSADADEPRAGRRSSGRSTVVVAVVAAIAAFALGCVVGVAVLAGDHDGAADDTDLDAIADFEAAAACRLLEEVPTGIVDGSFAIDDPELWRVQAVVGLGQAAAAGDRMYRRLGEAGDEMRTALLRLDEEIYVDALERGRRECESLFPSDDS